MKKLICNEVVRCQPASLRRKLFHTSSFMYFTFIFSGCITITSSEEGLKVCEYNFFQRKVVLLVIYLFIFMLNMVFDILLSAVFGFLRISQNSQENTCARVSFLTRWFRITYIYVLLSIAKVRTTYIYV